MCDQRKENPNEILRFIRDWEVYTEGNEGILRICREHKVVEAVVYLLEQRGEYEEAFDVLNEVSWWSSG